MYMDIAKFIAAMVITGTIHATKTCVLILV